MKPLKYGTRMSGFRLNVLSDWVERIISGSTGQGRVGHALKYILTEDLKGAAEDLIVQ